jgi:hypothetical protein
MYKKKEEEEKNVKLDINIEMNHFVNLNRLSIRLLVLY